MDKRIDSPGPKGAKGSKMLKKTDGTFNFENGTEQREFAGEKMIDQHDLVLEKILDNINNTPIGRVLKRIASMPEVSQKKILGVRQQLSKGEYDITDRLDRALDKVLDDLSA